MLRIAKVNGIKFSKIGLLYTVSMTVVAIHQAGIFPGYYLTPFIIGIIWFALGLFAKIKNSPNGLVKVNTTDKVVLLYFLPWCVFFLHNCVLFLFGLGYKPFMKSSFVQVLFVPCIILGVWGAYYLLGRKTLYYLLHAIGIQYVVVLLVQLVTMGPGKFFSGVASILTGNSVGNPFETNSDVVLALGILLIYLESKLVKKIRIEYRYIGIVLILFVLGGKRICYLAIFALLLFFLMTEFVSEKKIHYIQNIVSFLMIIGYYIFIYIINSGILSSFVWTHGINTMGRINMWDYIAKKFEMKLTYMGKGYSYCNLLLEKDRIYTFEGHVYALHSDALKMFVELGFLMFSFWLLYNLLYMEKKIRKNYGYYISNVYWAETIYMFVLYLTDNAINYYIVQTMYIVTILELICGKKTKLHSARYMVNSNNNSKEVVS